MLNYYGVISVAACFLVCVTSLQFTTVRQNQGSEIGIKTRTMFVQYISVLITNLQVHGIYIHEIVYWVNITDLTSRNKSGNYSEKENPQT